MIYVVFTDRLGNNLFQFAAAISLNSEITICVPLETEYHNVLTYGETFFKGFPIINYVPEGIEVYEEPFYHFNEIPYNKDEDLILKGYFQSYKYFDLNKVLDQYVIDKNIYDFIKFNYPEIVNRTYTSIHVRRGDYLRMLYKHPICGLKYYQRAIEEIGKNENYIVVSDDILWCKKNLNLQNVIFVENSSPIIDLYIHTFCKNNIISNSSFSWWGALLNRNNGIVIAPKLWFGFMVNYEIKDLLPPQYLVLDNPYSPSLYCKAILQLIFRLIHFHAHQKFRYFSNV